MAPPKRKVSNRPVDHHGRVTGPRNPVDPARVPTAPGGTTRRATSPRQAPAASSRYTPPIKSIRFRPESHRWIGFGFLILGIAIAIANEAMLGNDFTLLPGGHSEFYLLLGILVAGYSMWWFGWFDREK